MTATCRTVLISLALAAAPIAATAGDVRIEVLSAGTPAGITAELPAAPWPAKALGTGAILVLPYYEVEVGDPAGETTMFAVRNNGATAATVRLSVFARSAGEPVAMEERTIAAHGVRTINLRFVEGLLAEHDGVARGFVVAEAVGGAAVLSGDYFRVDASGAEANGGTLLAAEDAGCRRWSHRFLSGGGFDGGTRVAFLALDRPTQGPTVAGNVYDEGGTLAAVVSVTADVTSFEVADAELDLPVPFGSIEWVFQGEAHGTVTTTLTANGLLSVGMEASCIDDVGLPAGTEVFELPGNFLTCEGCGNWQFDMPFGGPRQFTRVTVDFDVFIAGWDPAQTNGFHCVFWLNNGTQWQQMMGYMNARGTMNRTVFQSNGPLGNPIGVETYAFPGLQAGERYHVHYFYDTDLEVVGYEVRDASGALWVADTIPLPAGVQPLQTHYTFLQFGSQPGGAVESLTEGWRWYDLRAVFIP